MNKYDFIADLLEKEKLDPSQKERMIKLIVNELKADGINQIEIEERIKQIEQTLRPQNLLEQQKKSINDSSTQTDLPDYIDPTQLSKFLRAYNSDSMLKYTCHEIDSDGLITINERCGTETFILGKFKEQLTNLFKDQVMQYSIPKNIWALINAYLNGGKEWSSDNIKVNWQSPELLEWSKNNIGFVPNPDNGIVLQTNNLGFDFIPFRSKIFETTIGSFSQLVIHFKNLFHIRADNSLKILIEKVNTWKSWDNQIDFTVVNFRDNVEFFTDVDKLLQAYNKIISIILNVSETYNLGIPKVELLLNEVDDAVLFSIHHKNSTYKKTIKNTIERIGQKHTELIKKQINGVCNLYIKADFGNSEFAEINLWNGEERKAVMKDKFSGVEYQLIFK